MSTIIPTGLQWDLELGHSRWAMSVREVGITIQATRQVYRQQDDRQRATAHRGPDGYGTNFYRCPSLREET